MTTERSNDRMLFEMPPARRRSPPTPRSAWPTGTCTMTPGRLSPPPVPARPALDQITGRLLAKNPAGRPATAAAARAGMLSALSQDTTATLTPVAGDPEPGTAIARGRWRLPRSEVVLAAALATSLAALAAVVLTGPGPARPSAPSSPLAATHPAVTPKAHKPASTRHKNKSKPAGGKHASALPPTAAAAAGFVGDLQAGVADGQVTQQAGQDLFSHLQPLLFGPPGQNA